MRAPASAFLALSLLPAAPAAQQGSTPAVVPAPAVPAAETAPGRTRGTLRYNVTFQQRSFDLAEFRAAIAERQPAAVVRAIVRDLELRARQDQEPFRKAIEGLGGAVNIQFWLINAASIEIPPDQLPRVRAMANVQSVDPDLVTWPLSPSAPAVIRVATDATHHNADAEQALGNKGTGYGLAVIDTSQNDDANGTNLPHMVYYRNADRNNHSAGGIDGSRLLANVALGALPPNNNHPHGTGVAGIMAGAGWNTTGADAGHASDAGIIGYSICNSGGCGSTLAIEAAAFQQAAADKVAYNIVAANMSYTSSPSPTDVSQQAIDACALNADILPVTAAANSSSSTQNSSSTANGLAVAAVDNSKVVAGFSSRGFLFGDPARYFPDISACGVNTVMPAFGNENADWVNSGTSMASPQVTGAAGLVKAALPVLNARELKALLLNNTEGIWAQNPNLDRNAFGMGLLRDDLACAAARQGLVLSGTINSTVTPVTYSLPVVANTNYAVTLVFHRHVLTSTQWSDLNLSVRNGALLVAASNTTRNLYEKVEFTAAVTGTFTIEVSAVSLEIQNLPFSVAFGTPTTVLPRTQVVLPPMPPQPPTDPTVFFIDIPWPTPFPFVPATGINLLLEVVNRGNSSGNAVFTYPLDAASGVSTTRLWGPDTATSGTLGLSYGLVTCFRGGATAGAVPLLGNAGLPLVNNSFRVHLSFAKASTAALLFLGRSNSVWHGVPLPLDLGTLGAPGCALLASGEMPSTLTTDANGSGSVLYTLPNDSALLGAGFYNQFVIYDPTANGLGFVTTRGGRGSIGNF